MRPTTRRQAFTLIEILVVVAIIALLVSILLPSLARARAQARAVLCQTNSRQLLNAFLMYVVENKGRFPGSRQDSGADWLGGSNVVSGQPAIYGYNRNEGKQPEWGTIYRYMGKQNSAYTCPEDPTALGKSDLNDRYSFTANLLLAGAKPEMLTGAHIPMPSGPPPILSKLDRKDHRTNMKALDGVPIIMEEHPDLFLRTGSDDSGWCNADTIAARHLQANGKGFSSLGYSDGHVGRLETYIAQASWNGMAGSYLQANYFCVRAGRKWISGWEWSPDGSGRAVPMYKFLDEAPDASASPFNVVHN